MIVELHFTVVVKHALATALHPQLAFLFARLTIQLVITHHPVQPGQRYLSNVTNTPIGAQCLTHVARCVVLVFGTQAQRHAFTQAGVQVHLPVAQLQTPVQAHAFVVGMTVQQLPVHQPRPPMGRPGIFARMTAIPGPTDRYTTTNGAHLRPFRRAP